MIDPDGKITTKKLISIRKSGIDAGTYMIWNMINFVDTPAEPKIKQLVQLGNNKTCDNTDDIIFTDQTV